jgi:hypothetical protein
MMSDESNNHESKPGQDISDKADELIGKGKDFADKAEDFFTENVNKLKSSDLFGKISGAFEKARDTIEDKAEEFQRGEMGAKFETFKGKTEDQVNEFARKAKEAGLRIGDQVDEAIDSLKGKKNQSNNQNGGGI